MSDVAIRVDGLGKHYQLGRPRERYSTLRDQFQKRISLRRLLQRADRSEHRPPFWALKDISFEVERGEVIGIIGRNGAGKSTLLKILSRITEPTEGEADIYGRVGSLLEVGTGFHPELSGRENVYLNGAIMGMKRNEIVRKFGDIVAFAEVEQFIDSPVKYYSSGMYMRLAFAVAAHMEPEILVVDEVLAVGDTAFQKRCLGKMGEVAKGGRTVLFVSHNFEAVKTLCQRTILLDTGRIVADTDPATGVRLATAQIVSGAEAGSFELDVRRTDPRPRPVSVNLSVAPPADIHFGPAFDFNDAIVLSLKLGGPIQCQQTFAFQVLTPSGLQVFNSFYRDDPANLALESGITQMVSVTIPARFLTAGQYEAVFALIDPSGDLYWITRNTWFEIFEIDSYRNQGLTIPRTGLVSVVLPWSQG